MSAADEPLSHEPTANEPTADDPTLDDLAPIRVVLVDDHPVLREGTRSVLERAPDIEVAGSTGEGVAALRLVEEQSPDVLLLDLRLPDLSGVVVAQRVRKAFPDVAILVLTGYDDIAYLRALLELGIQGYLRKTASSEEIVAAVRAVARGHRVLPDGQVSLGAGASATPCESEMRELTTREHEVLQMLANGQRNSEIGEVLGVSTRTVEFHVGHILDKLKVRSRTEAILAGRRLGLVVLEADDGAGG